MNNFIKIYEEHLKIEQDKLIKIFEEILPMEQKRDLIQKNIEALEHLIKSNKVLVGSESILQIGRFVDKSASEAYKELAKEDFREKGFREREIRELVSKEGLRIKGKPIARPYSRTIIRDLLDNEFLERVDRGLFRFKKDGEIRKIRFSVNDHLESMNNKTGENLFRPSPE